MEIVKTAAIVAGAGAATVATANVALPVLGFTKAGVAAGSIASGIQSSIGCVTAGSTFAGLQSAGAAGMAGATQVALGAAGAAAAGLAKLFSR